MKGATRQEAKEGLLYSCASFFVRRFVVLPQTVSEGPSVSVVCDPPTLMYGCRLS